MSVKTPRNPNGAGRKPLLSKELEEEYLKALRLGLSQARSARWAGVAVNTIKNWLERGEKASSIAVGKRTAFEQKCFDFLKAHDKAEQEWLVRSERVLNLSQSPANSEEAWARATVEERRLAAETSKFKLTHLASNEYTTKTQTEITGPDGGPVQISGKAALEMLRELASDDE